MSPSEPYLEAARAYADGVRVLFTPSGQESGERGGRGPESYSDLAAHAERLAPLSAQVTEEITGRLSEAIPEERMEVETALLAKALTDLEVSSYLLQAAQDDESEAEFAGERHTERSVSSLGTAEPYLKLLLSEEKLDPSLGERMTRVPRNMDAARAELTLQSGDALAVITERAGNSGKVALEGLIDLGEGEIARAIGVIGQDIAKALGRAEKVARLFNLFRDFLVKAYESLKALLGPTVTKVVGDRVKSWVEEIMGDVTVDAMLEKLYETQRTRVELRPLIQETDAPIETYVTAIEQVGGLNNAFRKQTDLVGRILIMLQFLTRVPTAVLPQAKLLLAAVYVLMGGYVILVGGDYVDARSLEKLDRVPGVRRVVEMNLAHG
jgi:hypothetical protein